MAVYGVSPDSMASHQRFSEKLALQFPLIVDADHLLAERCGVWIEKSMYGKKYMGIQRSSFAIGPDGIVRQVWRGVKPEGHAAEVLAYLTSSTD